MHYTAQDTSLQQYSIWIFYLMPTRNNIDDSPSGKLALCLFAPPGPSVVSSSAEGHSACP